MDNACLSCEYWKLSKDDEPCASCIPSNYLPESKDKPKEEEVKEKSCENASTQRLNYANFHVTQVIPMAHIGRKRRKLRKKDCRSHPAWEQTVENTLEAKIAAIEAENARLRELIGRLAPMWAPFCGDDDRGTCVHCGGGIHHEAHNAGINCYIFNHKDNCPWVEARALLEAK